VTPAEVEAERLAIALEAGVEPRRAQHIAACERVWAAAREMGTEYRCECGAHPRAAEGGRR
jgi:hypothetical protein